MIRLTNISKTFSANDKSISALSGVSLQVQQGEIYGVIGTSGAGKSTLIRCVNLLEKPSCGSVVVDGQSLTELSDRQLMQIRRSIAMIFQHFNLLASRTVFDNVALPLELSGHKREHIHEKVVKLLTLVGLSDKHHAYPSNLSGGQKQRVAIARALANDPKVLLCDEATSALDPATTQSILNLLKEINQRLGITILLITHEMEVVKGICDKVAVLDHGRLVESGSVAEIFANPQSEITKKFIRSTVHHELPTPYQERLSCTQTPDSLPLIKCEFTGKSVDAPLLSLVSKKFDVDFSILISQIDYVGGVKFGFVIVEIEGSDDAIARSINYLQEHKVKVEVLGYVR